MTIEELNALRDRILNAWEQFCDAIKQTAESLAKIFEPLEKEEQKKPQNGKTYFYCSQKKKDYLCNRKCTYRIEQKPQKNLPYQRRNY